jgi:hypothetical protein
VNTISELAGIRILAHTPDGVTLAGEADALDLIGAAMGAEADVVTVPADRVAPAFYSLSSGIAGQVVLKFAGYRVRLVVLGDQSERIAASESFRAFVYEINKGRDIWFLADQQELAARLGAGGERQ